ncbi:BTAD domain-containing putative transcriptional regulator [Catenulispora subtropica]|uniref:BTAD domain-containing putative transcriptional regulator n=1 Tax=Catenulispora subtropica TaxID=450798 RepID=A0ABN2SUX9_9ACTN
MRIALLGPLSARRGDGTAAEIGGPRVRALTALLALQAGHTVPATRLIDAVWGEQPPTNTANALQTLVKRLRAACGPDVVLTRPGGYSLAVAADAVDAHRFTARVAQACRLAADGSEQGAGDAAELLAQALQEWSGPAALPELRDFPVVGAAAVDLDEARLGAVEMLADCRLRLGRAAASIGSLITEVAAHPLRESLTARLVAALAAAGRRSEALTVFQRARELLAAELGVGPSGELAAAYTEVLRQEQPLALATRSAPTNLPRSCSSFIGRDAETGAVSTLLEDTQLVTLTGAGGTGKTRLAVAASARLTGGFPDGVWLVELAAVTDPARVGSTVLAALGIREDGPGRPGRPGRHCEQDRHGAKDPHGESSATAGPRAVAEVLADRRLLLVVDNCEHLLSAIAPVVQEIVVRCPGVKVLATSREPLDLPGEHVTPVPALSLPRVGADPRQAMESAAVRLFLDRAALARPGFQLDAANCAAVCAVCRELDGIPLALELAATRMRSMSPADLAAGLTDRFGRFGLLAAGRPAADPRHRSLRAVVAWSWDLLTEAERDLARGLAVFAGGTDTEAVAGVFGRPAVATLAALVDKSFVQWDGSRYRMLETIRAYAAEDADAVGVLTAAGRRHAEYFTSLAEQAEPELRGAGQPRWASRLTAEHDNMAAALDWALANGQTRIALRLFGSLSWYLVLRGHRSELTAWRRRVLALVPAGPPPDLTSAYLACAYAADLQDHLDPERWSRMAQDGPGFPLLYEQALSEERTPHPQFALATAVHASNGCVRELAALVTAADPWLSGIALLLRGGAQYNDGRYAGATTDLTAAVAVLRRVNDRVTLIRALLTLATVIVRTDSTAAAAELLREADELITDWAAPEEAVNAFAWIAHLHYWDADLGAAEASLERARNRRPADMTDATSVTLSVVEADVLRARGDRLGALARYAEVIRVLDEGLPPDDPIGVYPAATLRLAPARSTTTSASPPAANTVALWCRLTYSFALIEDDDPAGARHQLTALLDLLRTAGHLPLLLGAAVAVAALAHAGGDPETAAVLVGAAASLHRERPGGGPNTARLLAATREALGDEAFTRATARGARLDAESLLDRLVEQVQGTSTMAASAG